MGRTKGRLETKVFKFIPLQDVKGMYVPFCNFHYHKGLSLTPKICEQRDCIHYKKLYIQK